jgi:hypothetical protein
MRFFVVRIAHRFRRVSPQGFATNGMDIAKYRPDIRRQNGAKRHTSITPNAPRRSGTVTGEDRQTTSGDARTGVSIDASATRPARQTAGD